MRTKFSDKINVIKGLNKILSLKDYTSCLFWNNNDGQLRLDKRTTKEIPKILVN